MSALRQLLAALWAAVWLRGRLLELRLRRLFGGGPTADGPDYQLAATENPVEGVDYELVDLPADLAARLDVTRTELLDHARATAARQTRPRGARRRRTASAAVVALLGLGALGAGASALVTGTTGVPTVDRLLGIYEQELDKPGASDRPGPSGGDLQPSPSKASEPIEVTLPNGSTSTTSFYVAEDGRICWSVADRDGDDSGTLSCESPAGLIDGMRDGGYVPGIELGPGYVVLRGYASEDVVRLAGNGPTGSLDVQLGKPWKPAVPGADPVKPFVAVGATDSDASEEGVFALRSYTFEAVTDDGRRLRIAP